MDTPPLSLYVHLPWCVRKCPYCDFNSYTAGATAPKARYLDALQKDLEFEGTRVAGRELISVFLGGGTPSFFSPAEIERVLETVRNSFRLAPDAEITMEANPGTVESGDPAGYRAAGVNRLSIGAQSFSPEMLRQLGRIHSAGDIGRAVDAARRGGFDCLNLDVMDGLPGQDIEAAVSDIEQALALAPEHFSWYQLTLEPNTVFHARPPRGLPGDAESADMQLAGQAVLAGRGYEQYEVSAYARDGRYCRHNLNYWHYGDYAAAGAGAHGKLTTPAGVQRYAKPAHPLSYMRDLETRRAADDLGAPLPPADRLFEFMLNGLRLPGGVDEEALESRAGIAAGALALKAAGALGKGLIERAPRGRWRATEQGRRFLNDLQAEFLP
jgi:oxygen-independent coproporphyrinogen-3 oxidase